MAKKKTAVWMIMTEEQAGRVDAGTVRLKADGKLGLFTATRTHDSKAATGRSPRQAIEALDRI